MGDAKHPPVALPETGSVDGVHLREGRYRGLEAPAVPPAFARGALYCVYPRAFSREGTLAAVIPELDRIAALGVTALWLLPVQPPGLAGRKGSMGSPYSIRDYRAVDPGLGTRDDMRRLVDEAHARGLAVLLDLVVNHAANDHVLAAEHPDWFARDAQGNPARRYAGWSDVADWRHDAPGATGALLDGALFWVRETGLDGFRCDVAGMVPRAFWRELHARLAEERPDHFLLAEWQDAELHDVGFHASYDWLLYRALRDVALGRVTASAVDDALTAWREHFPAAALPLRFLENHDEPRAMAIIGRERLPAYAAVAILSGGLPLLYNGQEVGAAHRPSLFEPEPIDWRRPGEEVEGLYRGLIRLHQCSEPWGPGASVPIPTDRPMTVTAFLKEGEKTRGLVVANLGRHRETVLVDPDALQRSYRRVFGGDDVLEPGNRIQLEVGESWVGES